MELSDVTHFVRALCRYYPTSAPKTESGIFDLVKTWSLVIMPYEKEVMDAALVAYVATDTKGFFPTPGMILAQIKSIGGSDELNEMQAWDLVSQALRNGIYGSELEFAKLPESVQRAVGSPHQLVVWASDPEYNESVVMSNFQRAYRAEKQRAEQMALIPENVRSLLSTTANKIGLEQKA